MIRVYTLTDCPCTPTKHQVFVFQSINSECQFLSVTNFESVNGPLEYLRGGLVQWLVCLTG